MTTIPKNPRKHNRRKSARRDTKKTRPRNRRTLNERKRTALNRTRRRVWAEQPPEFFDEAIIDADGTLVGTDAECKRDIDRAYDGTWGYHPLVVSLANTAEPLFLVNRPGNRPSHEGAHVYLDK